MDLAIGFFNLDAMSAMGSYGGSCCKQHIELKLLLGIFADKIWTCDLYNVNYVQNTIIILELISHIFPAQSLLQNYNI